MERLEEARGAASGAAAELEHTRGEAEQALRAARQAREAEEARRQAADARLRAIEARPTTGNGNGFTVLIGNGEAAAPGSNRGSRPAPRARASTTRLGRWH